ncbi:levansucrase [Ligilactobacillus hayakitensis DSM 18933 = JCM 14209]|uniref:Levansucrase n=1 Tax=Ligilactobacillus hayakitensis DSM 18933 = JCM 14209 TaxID=1423755 RepID=A0A0R1WQB6_9LACO|nr:glycoside hydrolase family 68 protein [Ligilactobacillus hayakitensis]KRM17302.1 levansucrase [Ligilactobacillus hayakitensis DSM 18933 = JCM 14209]
MKEHKKMYKAGKNWVVASIVTGAMASGLMAADMDNVQADTTTPDASSSTTNSQDSSASEQATIKVQNQASTPQSKANTTESTSESNTTAANTTGATSTSTDNANPASTSSTAAASSSAATSSSVKQDDTDAKKDSSKASSEITSGSKTTADDTQKDTNTGKTNPNLSTKATDVDSLISTGDDIDHQDTSYLAMQLNDPKAVQVYNQLTTTAKQVAAAAKLVLKDITPDQIKVLNKIYTDDQTNVGTRFTHDHLASIVDKFLKGDSSYTIPYTKAKAVVNMPAMQNVKDAKTGEIANLEIWDSWPVQDARTGLVQNWNGYQLVVAMAGEPHKSDDHLYLLYSKYGDNDFNNWKVAGSIFGYGLPAGTGHWSGSATVNSDGSVQLFYTNVTWTNNTNYQRLATLTMNLGIDGDRVYIKNTENDHELFNGDGYYYQNFQQWLDDKSGVDNFQLRDPHIFEDADGSRYLVFESATGSIDYQGENQVYNWDNYGGTAKDNLQRIITLSNKNKSLKLASVANGVLGLIKLDNNEKNPSVAKVYRPLVSALSVSDELERPVIFDINGKYYLFTATRLNRTFDVDSNNEVKAAIGDNVGMLGYVADSIDGEFKPLNGDGLVLATQVSANSRTATYSYFAVKINPDNIKDKTVTINGQTYDKDYFVNHFVLVTAYMSNRGEAAGKDLDSTLAPSFLLKLNDDGTTQVVAKSLTDQGVWDWNEDSTNPSYFGTKASSSLTPEDFTRVEVNDDSGHWKLFDKVTRTYLTGFQYIRSSDKTVYYDQNGDMLYGQQFIDGHWYLFDETSGARQYGFQTIKDQNKTVYYNDEAQMQYGFQKINNKTYYFDKSSGARTTGQRNIDGKWYLFDNQGVMQTGLQFIANQNKFVYYNQAGQMQYGTLTLGGKKYTADRSSGAIKISDGQQYIDGHWYLIKGGRPQTGFQYIANQKKTVYYNNQGQMQYGQQYINGHWYLFDKSSGAMKTGFQYIAEQKKTVYYNNQGQMQYGQQYINGKWYLFDKSSGAMKTGFQYIADQKKTVYYNNKGQMQYGQQYINGHWYLFDKSSGAMKTGFQYIAEQKKTVYYNSKGQMQYGQQYINGKWYLFDKSSGKVQTGFQYIKDQNKTVYYSPKDAHMLYGQQYIDGKWYYFDKSSGAMQTGFKTIAEQNKTVYYNNKGQMQYGQQYINGHWYLFDRSTGAMKYGFQHIREQNKTVYYNRLGQMVYGKQVIDGKEYSFNAATGALMK